MNSMTKKLNKDNCEVILAQAKDLIYFVEQAYHQGEAVHEVERGLFSQLLRMGYELLELFFGLCGDGDQGECLTLTDGQLVKRLEKPHRREYQSVFGEHQLERVVYGRREGQKLACVPLDHQLQLPAHKFSYLLQEWDQSLAVEHPYHQVNEVIARILGLNQSVASLERINQHLSNSVDGFWDERPLPPLAQGDEIIVCSGDAKGVVIRGAGSNDQSSAACSDVSGNTSDGKKMALIGAIYTVAPYVRTPEQMLNMLFPTDSTPKPPSRPKPLAKYVRASLERDVLGTMVPSYQCIFSWLADQHQQRNPSGTQPVVVLMDGQKSLWSSAQEHFSGVDYVEILDLMHALGYLWDGAELVYPGNEKGQRLGFVKQQTQLLLKGQVLSVIDHFQSHMTTLTLSQQCALDDIIGYFRNNAPRMNYDQYLQAGYPIASGVIEGACRHVVCDRMEHSGMRWVIPGAQAMLKLRCIGINQDWDSFMAFHIKRENQRLYSVSPANDENFVSRPLAVA